MIVLAAMGSTSYNLLFVVHILAIVGAFGPTFAYATMNRAARDQGTNGAAMAQVPAELQSRVSLPALIVAILAGVGLVVMSDGVFDFGQPWVSASFTVVLLLLALILFSLLPALKRHGNLVSSGGTDEEIHSAKAMVGMGTGFLHLGLVALVVLMTWKPGL